jgi:glutathione peroxidase-family protein
MKLFIISGMLFVSAALTSNKAKGQTIIYNQNIQKLDESWLNLQGYAGKKILIAAVSPANLQAGVLAFYDSMQKANPAVAVIILPALDFGGTNNSGILDSIKNANSLSVTVTAAKMVTKASGNMQDALMSWLTHREQNSHFNEEVNTDNHIFLISEAGILYAVLDKSTAAAIIDDLLHQPPVNQ